MADLLFDIMTKSITAISLFLLITVSSDVSASAQTSPVSARPQQQQLTIENPSITSGQSGPQTTLPRRNIGAFFGKLRAGKAITIAYLGGSITAGAGAGNPEKSSYRALVTEWLRKNHPRNEISEINAAVSGSGSLYGALRARRDLIAYKPDLVFVEFAVSDAGDDEMAVKKAVEGLIRQLLIVPQPPEIVMLYATTAKRQSKIEWHEMISAHYQIPSLNLQELIWTLIDSGKVSQSSFWKDGVHSGGPTDAGHKIYADLITSFLAAQEKLAATPIARNLPPPLVSDEMNYGEFKAIAEIKPDKGLDRGRDANWKIESNNDRTLPTSLLSSDKTGAQIEYYFEGTVVGISYRMGPDCGMIEVLIDGRPAPAPLAKIDCYDATSHIGTRIIAGGLGPGEHKLTIRVTGEKNAKSSGTHVRLGYLLVGGTRPERL